MSHLTKTYISLQSLQHLLISCRHLNSILIQKENYFLNSTFWLAMCWYPTWSLWKTCACRGSSMSSECAKGSSHCWDSPWARQQCPCPIPAQPQLSSLRGSSFSSLVWTEIIRMLALPAPLQLFYFSSFSITCRNEHMQKSPCSTGLCSQEIIHSLHVFIPPGCHSG